MEKVKDPKSYALLLPACLPTGPVAVQVELVRGGHDIPVTNDNVVAYIHRVADYKLNQQIREPTAAFLR
jgi:hypothetical protein